MKPGDPRLLHLLNALVAVGVTAAGMWIGGSALAMPLSLGAATTTVCILAIAFGVKVLTQPAPRWQRGLGSAGYVGQLMLVGWVIWKLDPDAGPFAGGVMAVLGATVVAALIDGVRQQRQEQAAEERERERENER